MTDTIRDLRNKDASLIAQAKSILTEVGFNEAEIEMFMSGFAIAMTIDLIGGSNLVTKEFFSQERFKDSVFTDKQVDALLPLLNEIVKIRLKIQELSPEEGEE